VLKATSTTTGAASPGSAETSHQARFIAATNKVQTERELSEEVKENLSYLPPDEIDAEVEKLRFDWVNTEVERLWNEAVIPSVWARYIAATDKTQTKQELADEVRQNLSHLLPDEVDAEVERLWKEAGASVEQETVREPPPCDATEPKHEPAPESSSCVTTAGSTVGKVSAPSRAGDWYCPSCGDYQFVRNKHNYTTCRQCGAPNPSDSSGSASVAPPPFLPAVPPMVYGPTMPPLANESPALERYDEETAAEYTAREFASIHGYGAQSWETERSRALLGRVRCHECGRLGHLRRYCPQLPPPSASNQGQQDRALLNVSAECSCGFIKGRQWACLTGIMSVVTFDRKWKEFVGDNTLGCSPEQMLKIGIPVTIAGSDVVVVPKNRWHNFDGVPDAILSLDVSGTTAHWTLQRTKGFRCSYSEDSNNLGRHCYLKGYSTTAALHGDRAGVGEDTLVATDILSFPKGTTGSCDV